jgi:septal ring factor EnvC (AmiA/AmiB activator)
MGSDLKSLQTKITKLQNELKDVVKERETLEKKINAAKSTKSALEKKAKELEPVIEKPKVEVPKTEKAIKQLAKIEIEFSNELPEYIRIRFLVSR